MKTKELTIGCSYMLIGMLVLSIVLYHFLGWDRGICGLGGLFIFMSGLIYVRSL